MTVYEKETSYNAEGLIDFYNRYLLKHEEQLKTNVILKISSTLDFFKDPQRLSQNNIFIVIDLQNDFLDKSLNQQLPQFPDKPPPPLSELSNKLGGPLGAGSFGVGSSTAIIEPIADFIIKNDGSLNKIFFSRDWHSSKHCSFLGNEGQFPPHCLTNSLGAAFPDELKSKVASFPNDAKIEVVYKGVRNNVDSFGAFKYEDSKFLSTRQKGQKCCGDNGSFCFDNDNQKNCIKSCSRFTGGFKREKSEKKDFYNTPFEIDDISSTKSVGIEINYPIPKSKDIKINNKLTKLVPFDIKDLALRDDISNNIYICGLAGDYCVQDTAINIRKKLQTDHTIINNKTNIYIIQDFTRYVMLPLFGPTGDGFSTRNHDGTYKLDQKFIDINDSKPINEYVFKVNFNDKTEYIQLPQYGVAEYQNPGFTKADELWHFLSNDIDILTEYAKLGIKIVVSKKNLRERNVEPSGGGKKSSRKYNKLIRGKRRSKKIYRR